MLVDVPVDPVAIFEIIFDKAVNCVYGWKMRNQIGVIRLRLGISSRRYDSRYFIIRRSGVSAAAFIRSSSGRFPCLILFLLDLLHIMNMVYSNSAKASRTVMRCDTALVGPA